MATEYNVRTMGGSTKLGPKSDDSLYAPSRLHGIQCYNCGLVGHVRSDCLRGQRKNLNGIGRTKTTPPSGMK